MNLIQVEFFVIFLEELNVNSFNLKSFESIVNYYSFVRTILFYEGCPTLLSKLESTFNSVKTNYIKKLSLLYNEIKVNSKLFIITQI